MNKTNITSEENRHEGSSKQGGARQKAGRGGGEIAGEEALSIEKVKEISKNLGEQVETQLHERPYVVLGAVAGVGFVAGSLLGSRLGQIAIALAGGYLVRNLINQAAGPGGVQKVVKEGIEKLTQPERTNG